MENNFKKQRTIYLSLLIAIGSLWGFTEFLIGTALKEQIPNNIIGSILIGVSFFFLVLCFLFDKKIMSILIPLSVCIVIKIAGTLIIGKSIFHSSLISPVASLFLSVGIFIALYFIFLNRENISLVRKIIIGAAGALLVSFLFPLLQYVAQQPICIKVGTTTPLSIYYSPVSILLGAIALPFGIYFNLQLKNFIAQRKTFSLAFGLNFLSFIFIALSFLMI